MSEQGQGERRAVSRGVDSFEIAPTKQKRGITSERRVLAAGVPQKIGMGGDWFQVLAATVDDLKAVFDGDRPVSVYQGLGFRRYYDEVELVSATGQTVEVMVGYGNVQDSRASANVNVTTNITPGNTVSDGGRVLCAVSSATLLLALDADRLVAYITNPSDNTLTMYIGTAAVDATRGTPLEPGTTLPFPTTAALYAYNADPAVAEYLYASAVKDV